MIPRVYKLVGGVYIVVVDAVGEGDHGGAREAPTEAAGDHRDKGFREQTLQVGLFLWVINTRVLSCVTTFLEAV